MPISAMKGSRQKNGMASATEDRRVKWAPDVYDPPVTSVCHSVSSSRHYRSKPRKKDNKEKREKNKQKKKQKTKSKKNHQNSFVLETPDLGLEDVSTSNGQSSPKNLGKHEAMILDYSIVKQSKCGSSFLRRSVSKMHFPMAEAT